MACLNAGPGRRQRRVREFLGLSQEQLARLAGVSQRALSRLETAKRPGDSVADSS